MTSVLVRVSVDEAGQDGHGNDSQVQTKGPVLEVAEIKLDAFFDRGIAAPAVDLRPSNNADFQAMPVVVAAHFLRFASLRDNCAASTTFAKSCFLPMFPVCSTTNASGEMPCACRKEASRA